MELQKLLIKELFEQLRRGTMIPGDYLQYECFDELVANCFAVEENIFRTMSGGRQ